MILGSKLGNWYGAKKLRDHAGDRVRKGSTFHEAQSVGLVYVDRDEELYNQVKRYVKFLHSEYGMRRVCAMAFVDKKAKQVPVYQAQKLEYQFFTRNDINWYQKPVHNVANFLDEPFDILIDLNLNDSLATDYLIRDSKANMKVGHRSKKQSHLYDVLIDTGEAKALGPYIDQVNFVLNNFSLK